MTNRLNQLTVFLNTDTLFSRIKRDLLLSFHVAGVFSVRWTEEILIEVNQCYTSSSGMHNKEKKQVEQVKILRKHFPDALVTGYNHFAETLNIPTTFERNVFAAAIKCNAEYVITDQNKFIPRELEKQYGVSVMNADEFLYQIQTLYWRDLTPIIRDLINKYKNPSFTGVEFIKQLKQVGLVKFAARLKDHVGLL